MMLKTMALAAALALLAPASHAQTPFAFETVAENLNQPVFLTSPAGDLRLFVVEQTGRIVILGEETPFLDIGNLVSGGGEQGLLGLAFHPDYAQNGRFYVNYTDRSGVTQIVGYLASADPDVADPASATQLLAVEQPYPNHNGGWIAFGPDGLLYVGMGDGGAGGDPHGNGQNPQSLLGKILRLDVDAGGAPEIFVSGVRNPWRNAFDGNDLYIADVGQNAWEEISVVSLDDASANLGWNVMEGDACFQPAQGCDTSGKVMPIHVYGHDNACSITGGSVYRGSAIPALAGRYVFADYCGGQIMSLVYADGAATDLINHGPDHQRLGEVLSFGTDTAGEIYVLTGSGRVVKLVPAG